VEEATFSANFKLVMAANNLPVNLTIRAGEDSDPETFAATVASTINHMLANGWNTREASLGPNQDIQEASAYIVGRSGQGVRVVHLFKPPLEKRTGYVYEEMLDKLPFRLTDQETEYPTPGVNPQLPRDERYLVRLPGTFQFIRTAQAAKDGAMAAKRYTAVYFVPASMQLELQGQNDDAHGKPTNAATAATTANITAPAATTDTETIYVPAAGPAPTPPFPNPPTPPAPPPPPNPTVRQALNELNTLFTNLFGPAEAGEALRYITHKYTSAVAAQNPGAPITEDPAQLTHAQITYIFQTVGNNPARYKQDWHNMKLGWLSRKAPTT
jgi:hypothetical protein